jgi:hypothetical protein
MRPIKLLAVALGVGLLVGCTTTSGFKEVKVRDYYCPAPHIPPAPELAINAITSSSTDNEVGIAYGKTVDQLIAYNKELLHELHAYEKMGKANRQEAEPVKANTPVSSPMTDTSSKYDTAN